MLLFLYAPIPVPTPAIPGLTTGSETGNLGGVGQKPPRWPRRPAVSLSLPPRSDNEDEDLYEQNLTPMGRPPSYAEEPTQERLATMLTPEEITRLVGQGIAAVRTPEQSRQEA